MKVLVYPSDSKINSYISRSLKVFGSGSHISFFDFRHLFSLNKIWNRGTYQSDLAVINWLENLLVDKQSGSFSIKGFIRYTIYFLLIKIFSKKQIYIRHNFYPHACNTPFCKKFTTLIINVFESMATYKASHSEHLVEYGYLYIPHPFYDVDVDVDVDVDEKNKPYYVIFGVIAKYKSIESVIDNWRFDEYLYIVGMCRDGVYLQELKDLAEGKNIIFEARYVSDSEAASIVSNAEAVVLPHNGSEMIVSGAYYFAVTYKTPVIVLDNKFYNFLVQKYDYQHIVILKSFGDMKKLSPDQLAAANNEFHMIRDNHEIDWLSQLKINSKACSE